MEEAILKKIQDKFEILFDILKQISPSKSVDKHPFSANPQYINNFMNCLEDQINSAMEIKNKLEEEIEEIKNLANTYKKDLEIDIKTDNINKIENLNILKDLYNNDLEKIKVERNKVMSEIQVKEKEINKIIKSLGDKEDFNKENLEFFITDDIDKYIYLLNEQLDYNNISTQNLKLIKEKFNKLKDIKAKLELKRQFLYDEIERFCKIFKIRANFSFDESIFDLKKRLDNYKIELEEKKKEFFTLLKSIRKVESYLGFTPKNIIEEYNQGNISEMKDFYKYLKSEQSKQFDDIFENTLKKLHEMNEVFGLQNKPYCIKNLTDDEKELVLEKMQQEIDVLLPKKEKFIEITNLISKRKVLLEKMTDFEKIASDPKRLFKSSFQLNTEEKFRNNAYPSLLKMEEALFKLLDSYENDFGIFIYKGKEYKTALRHEIDSRIINKTVFINRFESPKKKN